MGETVKLVFDAFWWTAGPPSLRHVQREIVFAWASRFPDDDITLVARSTPTDAPAHARVITTRLWPQALVATRVVADVARSTGADLVLSHNFAPKTRSAASTIYLHDVLFETNPEWFTRIERAYFSLMTRWVKRADVVFTSSEAEARRIRENSAAGRVLAVGLGLSTELAGATSESPDDRVASKRFIATVGRLNVRKNLARTIEGAVRSGAISTEFPLIVIGPPGGKAASLSIEAQKAIDHGAVIFTGFVSEERLRWYYSNTALFVFLSLGEGFGMPPVEAAHFGAPLLVSDLSVFRENLGDAATFVDPRNTEAIAAAIYTRLALPRQTRPLPRQHDWISTVEKMREAAISRQSAPV